MAVWFSTFQWKSDTSHVQVQLYNSEGGGGRGYPNIDVNFFEHHQVQAHAKKAIRDT